MTSQQHPSSTDPSSMAGLIPDARPDARPDVIKVGERRHFYFNDAGQPAYQVDDLTAQDFLNPQPDDRFFHGEVHDRNVRLLASMLHHHHRYSPTASIHMRPKIVWPDPSLDQPMPDVVVVNHLADQHRHRPVLNLAEEQQASGVEGEVTVRAIFEVTSPLLADYDLEVKRALYARAGVPEYWVIDSGLRPDRQQPHFTILGFRLVYHHYEPIQPTRDNPTRNNRWESELCRLWLEVAAGDQGVHLGDLRTGKALPTPAEDDDPSISAQAEANRRAQSIAGQLKL